MMKNLLFFAMALGFISIVALKSVPTPPASAIKGTIYISADSTPLAFFSVSLWDSSGAVIQTVLTDSSGNFLFDSIPGGQYAISWQYGPEEQAERIFVKQDEVRTTALYSKPFEPALDEDRAVTLDVKRADSFSPEPPATTAVREAPVLKKKDLVGEKVVTDKGLRTKSVAPSRGGAEFNTGVAEEAPEVIRGAGVLTAGEINDFAKWKLWEDLAEKDFSAYQQTWQLFLNKRYPVQVTFENGTPVVDAEVKLVNKDNEVVFIARTDNTGRAELWADVVPGTMDETDKYQAKVTWNEQVFSFKRLKKFPDGWNNLSISATCNTSDVFDIAFVVDATGSMGDEIDYLKAELTDVINRAKAGNQEVNFRLASVFYKDHGDDYLTRKSDFTNDAGQTMGFIKNQFANGGGDFPEAVDAALDVALNQLTWSPVARGRVMFLVLDAPPHQDPATQEKMQKLILKASAMGVRIIPVTGSGIDKGVEFLMRSMSLATGGTYVFLTDHSGIGGSHLAPSTDTYHVEKLNDLMLRLINQFAASTGCNYVPPVVPVDTTQTTVDTSNNSNPGNANTKLTMQCYPNPTSGPISIDVNMAGGVIYVADIHGRFVMKIDMKERTSVREEMGQLASGSYVIKYRVANKEVTEKVIVVH